MLFYNIHLLDSVLKVDAYRLRTAREGFPSGVAERWENSVVCASWGGGEKGTRMSACLPWSTLHEHRLGGGGAAVNQVKTPLHLTAESAATTVSDNVSACG